MQLPEINPILVDQWKSSGSGLSFGEWLKNSSSESPIPPPAPLNVPPSRPQLAPLNVPPSRPQPVQVDSPVEKEVPKRTASAVRKMKSQQSPMRAMAKKKNVLSKMKEDKQLTDTQQAKTDDIQSAIAKLQNRSIY